MVDHQFQMVEILPTGNSSGSWQPVAGTEAFALLDTLTNLNQSGKSRLRDESLSILCRCANPTGEADSQIGLVIGYVQSGKTMSFTTVTALARDNRYRLVILIAGTSQHLFNQSVTRLERDLRLRTRTDRQWLLLTNPRPTDARLVDDTLTDWRDTNVPSEQKRTILIVVMKHFSHLQNLLEILLALDVTDVPALIFDDEADQAGMNTMVNQGEESSTYRRLTALRHAIPNHSYLQYTATPQAPLLINIIDSLSPNFAEVLTPGEDYIGGLALFEEHRELIRTIPVREVPERQTRPIEPPDSLLTALRLFFLGVAAGYEQNCVDSNRSMMVHPSQSTELHEIYHRWIVDIVDEWKRLLDLPSNDLDRIEFMEDFSHAVEDLSRTTSDLPDRTDVFSRLPQALRNTRIELVNSTEEATDKIDWRMTYPFILVGGKAMDRGFTVEGLTVTYMPRSPGIGNADTIQQRARFFGYKRSYLGYCRVFLQEQTIQAFTSYVEHEEEIRKQLLEHRGHPLDQWKRAFFLEPNLRPTRNNVLNFDYIRGDFAHRWFYPKAPHESSDIIVENRQTVRDFLNTLELADDEGHLKRTIDQRHKFAEVPLLTIYSELLIKLKHASLRDSQQYTGLLLQIKAHLENNRDDLCCIYNMLAGRSRQRKSTAGELGSLFQGSYSLGSELVYPGDAEIRSPELVTVQVHNLSIREGSQSWEDVPTVAVRLPVHLSASWISQQQGT